MRPFTRCILALAASVLAVESLAAQETTPPRTHAVVRGDNLWDLAQKYLGNPFLWTEIYRLNRDVVEDPHWIYPGETLRLPGAGEPTAALPAPGQTPQVPTITPPTTQLPTQPPVSPTAGPTVFHKVQPPEGNLPLVSAGAVSAENVTPTPTIRPGEVMVAPYVDREGGPRGYGRILKSGDLPGIGGAAERLRYQVYDRVLVSPPVAQVASEGERYLAYRLGPILEDQGQIVIPTGVIEITKAARSGTSAIAQVIRSFNELTAEDRLIPLDTAGIMTTVRAVRVTSGGATTDVKWVYGEPVLPNVQSFVVLGLSSTQGIRMGDEFLIFKEKTKGEFGELGDPEIPISRAQVVRSTPFGVTAVIIGQEQPAIKPGMAARVSARMP